ncbi:hypothetical protein SAMN05421736_101458 [Evansella caseinilytica]|uniref:Uncharacterized protein n=1 Tax=Evansella caseinilytica TaxID=1503961 RepID=A0A1H3HCK5_9BACI|nr:hypothetical protein [Evansella caseinilytica]SDY13313.1 hypothetical protein SAMN05421736_101458 [Evansella caseinilytica]
MIYIEDLGITLEAYKKSERTVRIYRSLYEINSRTAGAAAAGKQASGLFLIR